jgi:uncharacterized protein (TIGR00255 family)
MALSSMTGFARTAFEAGGAKFAWELKSVNARGLELRVRLPPGMDYLEGGIRGRVRDRLSRGSCFFALAKESEPDRPRLSLNEEALALVIATARRLATVEGIALPSADGLLALPGVLQDRGAATAGEDNEQRDAAILDSLGPALEALRAARLEEGRRLRAVLDDQLSAITRLVGEAQAVAAGAPELLKARIRDQVALLTSETSSLDPDRLHQEAVLAATRADIREELDRLTSHVAAVRELINSGDAVGRRLEFLAQEFNREANTLCSKAFDKRLTGIGVELKSVIDQFREQVQNLE